MKCCICETENIHNNRELPLIFFQNQFYCPNCYSQFDKKYVRNKVGDESFIQALKDHKNIRQALIFLNLTAKGANYVRANKLLKRISQETVEQKVDNHLQTRNFTDQEIKSLAKLGTILPVNLIFE